MNPRAFGLILLAVVIASAMLLWGTSIPLGVPGEWTWPRLPATAETLYGGIGALMAGVMYVGFVLAGRSGIDSRSRGAIAGWLASLVAFGFAWLWTVQQAVPAPANLGKVPYVLYYPRSSGYFWQARYEVSSCAEFLAGYEALLAERDYLHIGTHPPGLTLCYRGLLAACEWFPAAPSVVLWFCPDAVRQSLDEITTLSRSSGRVVTPVDQAALWLSALIVLAAAAATSVLIYVLVHRHFDREAAWTAAGLWPLVPAIAVFHPKSDTLFPLVATGAAALWMVACDRRSLVRAFLAGFVLWLGMMLSLAFVTIGLLLAVMTTWEWQVARRADTRLAGTADFTPVTVRAAAVLLAAGATGFLIPTLALGAAADLNLFNVWRWNFANHALFYEKNVRTWWTWLVVNPVELAMAVGMPVALTVGLSVSLLVKSRLLVSRAATSAISFAAVWGLLWLSGKNMGEAARLWGLLMPWVVMSTAPLLATDLRAVGADVDTARLTGAWLLSPTALILAAQMVVCILTVLRIDGFHFTELVATQNPAAGH